MFAHHAPQEIGQKAHDIPRQSLQLAHHNYILRHGFWKVGERPRDMNRREKILNAVVQEPCLAGIVAEDDFPRCGRGLELAFWAHPEGRVYSPSLSHLRTRRYDRHADSRRLPVIRQCAELLADLPNPSACPRRSGWQELSTENMAPVQEPIRFG